MFHAEWLNMILTVRLDAKRKAVESLSGPRKPQGYVTKNVTNVGCADETETIIVAVGVNADLQWRPMRRLQFA